MVSDHQSNDKVVSRQPKRNRTVIESLAYGSLSSAFTTIIFQPLELIKTRIQIRDNYTPKNVLVGRATLSAIQIVRQNGLLFLWKGTAPSLVRSIPGVGVYYASLDLMQRQLSSKRDRPDNGLQAFYFALASRSLVSSILLPVTVVKVRYESGSIKNLSLFQSLKDAYARNGWVGLTPTLLRDSLFSGVYYMTYTMLKSNHFESSKKKDRSTKQPDHKTIFAFGLISGFVASLVTNPFDVLKTNIQSRVDKKHNPNIFREAIQIFGQERGYFRLLDGLGPRTLRRSLIAATTWTFFEFLTSAFR